MRLGTFELATRVARGGMGEIWTAYHRGEHGFRHDAMVKLLLPHFVANREVVRMFRREALLLAEFDHPAIPRAYDFGRLASTWYLAMERIRGRSVADLMGTQQHPIPPPLDVALAITARLTDALEHVHEASTRAGRALLAVHRDVNPTNVMITKGGFVKLIDFGVAYAAVDLHPDDAQGGRGTVRYSSPEQIRGGYIDGRADVFSLGVTLFHLLTGKLPFTGTDPHVMTQIVELDAPQASAVHPRVSPDLDSLVAKALARDPNRRFQTMDEFGEALRHFAATHQGLASAKRIAEWASPLMGEFSGDDEPLLQASSASIPPFPSPDGYGGAAVPRVPAAPSVPGTAPPASSSAPTSGPAPNDLGDSFIDDLALFDPIK